MHIIISWARFLVRSVTHLISPPYCICCETLLCDYNVVCEKCFPALPKIFSHKVPVSQTRHVVVHAFTAYQRPFDRLIQAKLSSQSTPIYQLAFLLSKYSQKLTFECDIIIPIPLHWQRKMWRGFNQAELLADEVALAINKPVRTVLKRVKSTQFQSQLSPKEREENITNAFVCDKKYTSFVKNKRVLLIDDLYTTGATAVAAAKELYKQGAVSVELLVACKVTT